MGVTQHWYENDKRTPGLGFRIWYRVFKGSHRYSYYCDPWSLVLGRGEYTVIIHSSREEAIAAEKESDRDA